MHMRRSLIGVLAVGPLLCLSSAVLAQQSARTVAEVKTLGTAGRPFNYEAGMIQLGAGVGSPCVTGAAGSESTPTVDATDPGKTVTGKLQGAASGQVQICVNGVAAGQADVNPAGAFTYLLTTALKYGDMVAAQVYTSPAGEVAATYGPLGGAISVGKCSEQGNGPRPTLDAIDSANVVTGALAKGESGTVRICADDREVSRTLANADGQFAFKLSTALKTGQKVSAQLVTSTTGAQPETYGAASDATTYGDSKAAASTNDVCGPGTRPFLQTPVVAGIKHLVGCSKSGSSYTEVLVFASTAAPANHERHRNSGNSGNSQNAQGTGQAAKTGGGQSAGTPGQTGAPAPTGKPLDTCDVSKAQSISTKGTPDSNGQFQVDFNGGQSLSLDEWVCVVDFDAKGTPLDDTTAIPILVTKFTSTEATAPWGRVRMYLAGGVVFGQTNGQFSNSDFFLTLHLDTNEIRRDHVMVSSFFDAQLTAVPVATCTSSSSTGGSSSSSCSQTSLSTFITSQKAAVIQGGVSFPLAGNWSHWSFEGGRHTFLFAPLLKAGVETPTSSVTTTSSNPGTTTTSTPLNGENTFPFAAAGVRLGQMTVPYSWNKAPYLLHYVDITAGKWHSFYQCADSMCNYGTATPPPASPLNLVRPWMVNLEGRLLIPKTPVMLGLDAYVPFTESTGLHGDVRFLFGVRLDVGCMLDAFKGGTTPSLLSCMDGTSNNTVTPASAPSTPSTSSAPKK